MFVILLNNVVPSKLLITTKGFPISKAPGEGGEKSHFKNPNMFHLIARKMANYTIMLMILVIYVAGQAMRIASDADSH